MGTFAFRRPVGLVCRPRRQCRRGCNPDPEPDLGRRDDRDPASDQALRRSRGTVTGLYQEPIGITLMETALGFVLGSAGGLLLGTCVALSRRFDYFIDPIIVMIQASAPLIII